MKTISSAIEQYSNIPERQWPQLVHDGDANPSEIFSDAVGEVWYFAVTRDRNTPFCFFAMQEYVPGHGATTAGYTVTNIHAWDHRRCPRCERLCDSWQQAQKHCQPIEDRWAGSPPTPPGLKPFLSAEAVESWGRRWMSGPFSCLVWQQRRAGPAWHNPKTAYVSRCTVNAHGVYGGA